MNSFQRICRSPAFLVLALILCAAVIAGGVALAPAAPKVWIVIPVLLAVAAVICFFVARSTSKAALQKKKEAENEGVVKADLDHAGIAAACKVQKPFQIAGNKDVHRGGDGFVKGSAAVIEAGRQKFGEDVICIAGTQQLSDRQPHAFGKITG